MADAVVRSRAGLATAERPVGSFLFLGPTGEEYPRPPMTCMSPAVSIRLKEPTISDESCHSDGSA